MRSHIICTPHKILLGWSNQREDWCDTWHKWGRREIHTEVWWVIPSERDHSENPDRDFIVLYFKEIGQEGTDWIIWLRTEIKWWACVNMVRYREILDQLRNYHFLKKNSSAWSWFVKIGKNQMYLISRVLCKGNWYCFYGMNLHSESTLVWERSQGACCYCKFQAKSPKSFFTFNEKWIISVTQNILHEFHTKKLTAQIYPPSVITYRVQYIFLIKPLHHNSF